MAALSAGTAGTIQGNAPRLDAATEAQLQNEEDVTFLDVKYGNRYVYTSLGDYQEYFDDALSPESPLLLTPAALVAKMSHVESSYVRPSVIDQDLDNFGKNMTIDSTTGTVYDYNNGSLIPLTEEQMNQRFTQLMAANIRPYVILESKLKVSTLFGDPRERYYPDETLGISKGAMNRYFINFRPITVLGAAGSATTTSYTGAVNDANWIAGGGWGFAHTDDLSKSFPTTGFNGAYFRVSISGLDATNPDLNWQVTKTPSDSNISATVSVKNSTTLYVSLTGPSSGDTGGLGPVPFSGPVTFEVKDAFSAVIYKFRITKWFIPKYFGVSTSVDDALNYCNTMSGYRPVTRADLSNSTQSDATAYPPYDPITGANNGTNPDPNVAPRDTGVGHAIGPVFAEWGTPFYNSSSAKFPDSDFYYESSQHYITGEKYSATQSYWVTNSGMAAISQSGGLFTQRVVCASQ
ncbi:hypothetical protein [Zophobihabitans entericus]|uniref:Uncharacterized protein n=1 Tax=Zophobihabitans entericus TaxID=1635327 RepID=A0A6G9IA60_9GAMM|nr:hypothetical protein [Zophobihabitans entericus]QIQ20470.1 hypothetical protein IPMB12_01505 [Zophobihabitans entericus]